ncbi:putative NBD/HSP70 family sugar kinase [Paenibacillus taihuensis]|uniref:Putative NBD/HSP70 family sugar kinase n=1 Tax=Paenibacillus taihuensis TaxID=1156355 RepID=A0A3D9Q8N3_9BACL|nr:ROK family protein [Paenibacillus taihuensis]REE56307.1 putative NBD/HSP70 family sugar kinase [Paenibacillus taihuensis]
MKSFLPNDIKDENRKIIFDILLQHPELAKVEITEKTSMSFVTVSKIVGFFEEIGLLTATGESREGSGGLGRKRTVYRLNANRYVTIGIQTIGKRTTALLVNLYGQIIDMHAIDAPIPFYSEQFESVFEDIVKRMRGKAEETGSVILGVGIGVDGAINNRKRTIRIMTQDGEEQDYAYEPLIAKLTERVRLPILLENDVNASIIAEHRGLENTEEAPNDLILISAGDGVGAGIILNKELHRGFNASAGELEYMCFDPDYKKKPNSVGWLESKLGLATLLRTYDLTQESQREACADYVSRHLALVIANMISILDIDRIIISGKTAALFPELVQEKTAAYVQQYTEWTPTITVSAAVHQAAIGAASLILQQEMIRVLSA